ncbi:hypothetical protein NL108_009904 [Boleophthalmus pectinirostris]|nr:hypothetical protein NL108_009904 [Boleophthalmus pectinirostris]
MAPCTRPVRSDPMSRTVPVQRFTAWPCLNKTPLRTDWPCSCSSEALTVAQLSPKRCTSISFGDLRSSCASTGGHYNPHHVNHPHHPGDFGNFMTENGRIKAMVESEATLFGGDSVLGRAVVVHQHQDDMGQGGDASSLLNGNAGPRVGCCVIGISSPDLWAMYADKLNP